jgi:[acyl-carrier-protein] S-malonyltransferase
MSELSGEPGAMYAVAADAETVTEACKNAGGFVIAANFNAPGQTVISGLLEPAARAAEALAAKGCKTVKLNVSGAFHTVLMSQAAERLRRAAEAFAYAPLKTVFYSNVTGGMLEIENYPEYFERHTVSPVMFSAQVRSMAEDGVTACVDFGPKKTAATLAKKNRRELNIAGISLEYLKAL